MKFKWSKLVILMLVILSASLITGCAPDVVTRANYDEIKTGMSYSEVVDIIGSEGDEAASTSMEGVEGVMPSITTKIYSWQNSDGSNMNVTFQNDEMISKAQAGL